MTRRVPPLCLLPLLLFHVHVLIFTTVTVPGVSAEVLCQRCPSCDFPTTMFREPYCFLPYTGFFSRARYPAAPPALATVAKCIDYHFSSIVGQPHVVDAVRRSIYHKLRNPKEPLRMHFGGDNGVGKTHLARHLSLLTSKSLHPSCAEDKYKCDRGENILEVQAGGYQMDPMEGRRLIVKQIGEHLTKYPHGVLLLDDLTLMDAALVDYLAPLFGRGNHFGEYPMIDLNHAIIIITSDFRGANHSRGFYSIEDLEAEIKEQAKVAYSVAPLGAMQTLAFWALDDKSVHALIELLVHRLPCRDPSVTRSSIEPLAVEWIAQEALTDKERLEKDSGRYVEQQVKELIDVEVSKQIVQHGLDVKMAVHCHLNNEGTFAIDFTIANPGAPPSPIGNKNAEDHAPSTKGEEGRRSAASGGTEGGNPWVYRRLPSGGTEDKPPTATSKGTQVDEPKEDL